MDGKTRDRLNKIRSNYDALAGAYAKEISGDLIIGYWSGSCCKNSPWRATVLICDLGCGPGHVTEYVSRFNASVVGLDLSFGILKEARTRHQEIIFLQGNMLDLPFVAAKLAGVIAFYSIIHFDSDQLSRALTEMFRVLQPGGLVLLGVHVGREVVHADELWGIPVDFDAAFFDLDELRGNLEMRGFKVLEMMQRDPHPDVEHQSVRGYIWARRDER